MSLYELLLALHIVASVIWLGAGFALTLLMLRAQLARDAAMKADLNAHTDWLAPRLFIPASFSTFLFGLLLVIEGSWDLDALWIVLGLAGWLASFGVGMLYFRTEGERLDALVNERGAEDPEVQQRLDRMEAVGRLEMVVLFLVVFDMAVKPTGDDTGLLIAGVAILVAAAVLFLRAPPAPIPVAESRGIRGQ
jgi:uncharacterized membrane protein